MMKISHEDYILAYLFICDATNGGEGITKELNLMGDLVANIIPRPFEKRVVEGVNHYVCPRRHTEVKDLLSKYCSDCGQALKEWI